MTIQTNWLLRVVSSLREKVVHSVSLSDMFVPCRLRTIEKGFGRLNDVIVQRVQASALLALLLHHIDRNVSNIVQIGPCNNAVS